MKYGIRKNGEICTWLELYDEDMFVGAPGVMKFDSRSEAEAVLPLVAGGEVIELEG